MAEQKIYVVLGYHVNYYHSWRGDRNDDTGFGMDTRIIRKLIAIMDAANERGLKCGGTWDFDNYWTLEEIMPRYAADILESMKRRVQDGHDEVIIDSWNNGLTSASTTMEFRENLKRTISNPNGFGIRDIFGGFSPVVRPQEIVWTQGHNELYLEQGIKAISLYYSSVPFDAFRNFVPKMGPNEMYNPLWLKSTESDAKMILIPTYSHGDVADNLSLKHWLKKIHNFQLEGEIPGDALVYINMDADADVWTGLGLPGFLEWIPNTKGIDEYTELLDKCPYAEYGTLGEYIAGHKPVGELELRQDMADGSFTGYSSWTEKEVNQRLWRISERARWFQRVAEHVSGTIGDPDDVKKQIQALLYGDPDSCFENKLRLLSTTHFGMNSPAINEERAQVAFHLARGAQEKASEAALAAVATMGNPEPGDGRLMEFRVLNQPKYQEMEQVATGVRTPIRIKLAAPLEASAVNLVLETADGLEVPFDVIDAQTDDHGRLQSGTLIFLHTSDNRPFTDYRLRAAGGRKPTPQVKASESRLASDSVQFELDADGRIKSFKVGGEEFASQSFLALGLTYKVNGKKTKTFETDRFEVESFGVGPRGKFAFMTLRARVAFNHKGVEYAAVGTYRMGIMAKLPYLFMDAEVILPNTPREHGDLSIQSRLKEKFDANWMEVMPARVQPNIHNDKGGYLRVWKHNYMDVTNYYDLNYGAFDPRNRNIDSCNNHVTDGWVAVSNRKKGLMISCDALVNTSPAYCPLRVRENDGSQTVMLNPFGAYYGKQFSHMPDGSGAAGRLTIAIGAQHRPTAPSFNGRTIRLCMMIAPYTGDGPREALIREANGFSLPPAVAMAAPGGLELLVPDYIPAELADAIRNYELDSCKGWTYSDFLTDRNRGGEGVPSKAGIPKIPLRLLARVFIDSLKGLF